MLIKRSEIIPEAVFSHALEKWLCWTEFHDFHDYFCLNSQ